MTAPLLAVMRELKLKADRGANDVGEKLGSDAPRKGLKKTMDVLKSELNEAFLTPPTTFDHEWLNRLQQ